jgi:hypothetical protein
MNVFVMYDEQGEIKGTVATANENAGVGTLASGKIHKISGVDLDSEDASGYLADLHANHRVDVVPEPRIVRVSGKSAGS